MTTIKMSEIWSHRELVESGAAQQLSAAQTAKGADADPMTLSPTEAAAASLSDAHKKALKAFLGQRSEAAVFLAELEPQSAQAVAVTAAPAEPAAPTVEASYVLELVRGEVRSSAVRWANREDRITPAEIEAKDKPATRKYYPGFIAIAAKDLGAHQRPEGVTVDEVTDRVMVKVAALFANAGIDPAGPVAESALKKLGALDAAMAMDLIRPQFDTAVRDAQEGNPQSAKTLAEWQALPAEGRKTALQFASISSNTRFKNLRATTHAMDDTAMLPAHKAFAERMHDFMDSRCDLDVDGGGEFALIGRMQTKVTVYELPSGEIAGGEVRYAQKGTHTGEGGRYDSVEEAEAAGVEVDTSQWLASGLFDSDMNPIRYDDHMEFDH